MATVEPIPFEASTNPITVPLFFFHHLLTIAPTIVVVVKDKPMPRNTPPTTNPNMLVDNEYISIEAISDIKPAQINFLAPYLYIRAPKNTFTVAVEIYLAVSFNEKPLRVKSRASHTAEIKILFEELQNPKTVITIKNDSTVITHLYSSLCFFFDKFFTSFSSLDKNANILYNNFAS